jgi:RNA polymerase sigma-70 factor (ECF subfamily)
MQETRPTLLSKLRKPGEEEAWEEFYRIYGPVILNYSIRHGLDLSGAEDVLQETMIDLLRLLPGFKYDPKLGRFRNFLLSIVHQRILAVVRRLSSQREIPLSQSPDGASLLDKFADPNALSPGRALDLVWVASLRDEVWQTLSAGDVFDSRTIAVYDAYVLQGCSADEVARRFGMKSNAVHQVKSRVEQRVIAEIKSMQAYLGGDSVP